MKVEIADTFFESLKRCFRPWWHTKELWYKLKCFAWYRYSTVRPRRLPHTWVDRSTLLPAVMFEVLSQFVEEECSPGHVEWYGENGHKIEVNGRELYVRDEIHNIYNWWNKTYNEEYERQGQQLLDLMVENSAVREFQFQETDNSTLLRWSPEWDDSEKQAAHEEASEQLSELEAKSRDELKEYMHRLVNVTNYLWT